MEYEENGKLYEAILQYKKALHLVPDIEFKVFNFLKEKGGTSTTKSNPAGNGKQNEQL